jgi:tellurite resistance protein
MAWETFEQLTLADALTERDVAMARADDHAAPDWKTAAAEAVRWCAGTLTTFTTDDVLLRLADIGAPSTHTLTALGPVMQAAARAGVIAKTGDLRASRLRQRHRDLTVWAWAPWVHR